MSSIKQRKMVKEQLKICSIVNMSQKINKIQSLQYRILQKRYLKMLYSIIILNLIIFTCKTNGQSTLLPISRCLGNCAVCKTDDLSTCSGKQFINCVKGYDGENCIVKQTFANELILMDSGYNISNNLWLNNNLTTCLYNNSKKQQVKVNVLGMYSLFEANSITFDVLPYYENFILSFDLIRGSWTPFTDLLKITITDQNQYVINNEYIEVSRRDDINAIQNPIKCNSQPYLLEKYQVQGIIRPEASKKITLAFEGMIYSGALWSITNVKLAIGCSKSLIFDGIECQECVGGYYPVRSASKVVMQCQACPLNCTICLDASNCTSCIEGLTLKDGKCQNNNTLSLLSVPNSSLICDNKILLLSSNVGSGQKLEFNVSHLPSNNSIRILFYLAYIPSQFTNLDKISVQMSGESLIQISGSQINKYEALPKQICKGFGSQGYFSLYKIVSPYFLHNSTSVNVLITINNAHKLGVYEVGIQHEQPHAQQNKPIVEDKQIPIVPIQVIPSPIINIAPVVTFNEIKQANQSTLPQAQNNTTANATFQTISNINDTNQIETNVINNTDSSIVEDIDLAKIIAQIEKVKEKVEIGFKQTDLLFLTIKYPLQVNKFPFFTANFNKSNLTLIPQIVKQTKQYQELAFTLDSSLFDQNVTLYMHHNEPSQFAKRGLQANNGLIVLGSVRIFRFDYLDAYQLKLVNNFARFFQIMSWIVIITTLILSTLGNSLITQKISLLLQVVFLHVYIFTENLPINFRTIIGGLHRMQNLNYFSETTSKAIEEFLLGNVVQLFPAKFSMFNLDINFSRAVYPSIIALLINLVSFIILNILRKIIQLTLPVSQKNQKMIKVDKQNLSKFDRLKLFICRTSERFMNFWHQVWQYMYLTFVFASLIQMYSFSYPSGSNRNPIPNVIFQFVCLILSIALPIATYFYLNKQYLKMDYQEYTYWYENIFFQKLPANCLPSNHHRILILIDNARYFLLAICFAFIGNYPIQALMVIILVNILSLGYMKISHVQIKSFVLTINIIEYLLLIVLAAAIMIAYFLSHTLNTSKYMVIGYVLVSICLLLVVVGLVRVSYNIFYKIKEQDYDLQLSQFKPAIGTERVV